MKEPFIIDAHMHTGTSFMYYAEKSDAAHYLELMNRLSIKYAICSDTLSLMKGARYGLAEAERIYQSSGGRIFYLGVFDPCSGKECLKALEKSAGKKGLLGVKIHPSLHQTAPESDLYDPVWRFCRDHDLALLTHSWSVSAYNPVQAYSTPERFRHYADKYPEVRFVLAHAGGRGTGRAQAVKMANEYPGVYLDFAGDIFCFKYLETMLSSIPHSKLIFGSDYPMLDPRANLTRVLLADLDDETAGQILCGNAGSAYKLKN